MKRRIAGPMLNSTRTKIRKVYLAGAIHNYADAFAWRQIVIDRMPVGWQCYDPVKYEGTGMKPKELVLMDLRMVRNSQAVIVRADVPSWGTAIELFTAHRWRIPVLAWDAPEYRSPWLTAHVTKFCSSLDHAIRELPV